MIVRKWQTGDTEKIDLQDSQKYCRYVFNLAADLTPLAERGHAETFEHDGEIIGVIALEEYWTNRANVFTLFSRNAGKHFKFIHKHVNNILDELGYRRYETTVDVGFEEGHRWMRLLDFELEGYLRAYRPDGADMILYARVK